MLRETQRALISGHPQGGINLQNSQGQNYPFLVDQNRITPTSLHPSPAMPSSPMALANSNIPINSQASAILSSNANMLLAHNNAHSGAAAMFGPVRLDNHQKLATEALSNQQVAMAQSAGFLGLGLGNVMSYEQALVQARHTQQTTTRREQDLIVQEALYSSQQRVVELLRQRQRQQEQQQKEQHELRQQQLRQLEEMHRHTKPPIRHDDPGGNTVSLFFVLSAILKKLTNFTKKSFSISESKRKMQWEHFCY